MAINFQQLIERIRELGLAARERRENLERLRLQAEALLKEWADKGEQLNEKLEHARQFDPSLRCAIPLDVPLNAYCDPPPAPDNLTLIAADGSQIAPDRHAAVLYSLVNVGAIVMQTGSSRAPEIFTDSRLLVDEEIYTDTGILTLEAIEQQRDIAERKKLLELAKELPPGVIALTDGPLELWGAKGGAEDEYRRNLEIHKSTLSQLQERGAAVAGYLDKPGADLVVRLLEIARLSSEQQFRDIRKQHSLRGVSDRWLYGRILDSGQRSAVFGMQSGSRSHYTGDLALYFFYLNVGDTGHPALVRVEIPKWVADDDEKLDLLHAALLEQCRLMGAHPYPYILHRAHEIAVVGFDEKKQVEAMLELELRQSGGEVGEASHKSSAKALPGRGKK
jgi:NurA domain